MHHPIPSAMLSCHLRPVGVRTLVRSSSLQTSQKGPVPNPVIRITAGGVSVIDWRRCLRRRPPTCGGRAAFRCDGSIDMATVGKLSRNAFSLGLATMLMLASATSRGAVSTGADGWTVLTPSPDSRVVHVSSSQGNDANDGLSPTKPKRTLAAGKALMRQGYPDWLVLRSGDVWLNESFGHWGTSGRSSQEPQVLSSYGSGP